MATPQSIITNAVQETREPSGDQALLDALTSVPAADLIPEITMWIEDVTAGMNVPRLIAAATLPLPEDTEAIIEVVERKGAAGLAAYPENDPTKLVGLIASLQEAGERA